MIAVDGATEDELAAIVAALLRHPERSATVIPSVAERRRGTRDRLTPWLAAARREALGDE